MKLKKNVATSEAGLIFNPGTGDSFSVNSIGNEILSRLKEGAAPEEITAYILSRYDVDRIQLEKDMDDFISQLYEYNLVDKQL
jgi:predicted Rdx family selenoprotein